MLTKLKKIVQVWIKAEADIAYKAGFTPNQISALGVILAIVSGLLYWLSGDSSFGANLNQTSLILAPIFLLLSGFCDALDGAMARLYGNATTFGGFLDSLLDRYADAVVYCGLILGGLCDVSWGLVALIGSLLVSYTRARAEAAGVKMETVGLAERADRLLIIILGSFVNLVWSEAVKWSIILLAVLTNFTVLQRATHFYKKAKA